jgi:hypothetical protein
MEKCAKESNEIYSRQFDIEKRLLLLFIFLHQFSLLFIVWSFCVIKEKRVRE